MKKIIKSTALLCIYLLTLCGCSNFGKLTPSDPVTLTMWHNYGGDMQKTFDTLVDEFNSTKGSDAGIVIDVKEISSSSELNKSLEMIANGDPGAPEMPDIFTGYPKIAVKFHNRDMLVDFDEYFSSDELSEYVDSFIQEGRLSGDGLYVFPIAKSTEILYLNKTLFDRFSKETGADVADFETFEGIAAMSEQYYEWSGGKQFYSADSYFNVAEVGMEQLGTGIINDSGQLNLDNDRYRHIFDTLYTPSAKGGIAIYDGYSSDLSKTGDLICSTGSSAGILFYGDTITYSDGTVEDVEYSILPYPVFKNGKKKALQRGGGLMVSKTNDKKEYAACEFIKWLTTPEHNMEFVTSTGYIPVTKRAFKEDIQNHLGTLEDKRVRNMLTTVLSMYESYEFFTPPNLDDFDDLSTGYESSYKKMLTEHHADYLNGITVSADDAFEEFIN